MTLHDGTVFGLEKVNEGVFVSGSWDKRIMVWNDKGNLIEIHESKCRTTALIVTAGSDLIEIRQLKVPSMTSQSIKFYSDRIYSRSSSLTNRSLERTPQRKFSKHLQM